MVLDVFSKQDKITHTSLFPNWSEINCHYDSIIIWKLHPIWEQIINQHVSFINVLGGRPNAVPVKKNCLLSFSPRQINSFALSTE